jgi:adenylate kinase family enzyme
MRVMILGNAGSGKSTLARRLQSTFGWSLLNLDGLWHADDYSVAAKQRLIAAQHNFMADKRSWIIDGNYASMMAERLAQADLIVVCQVSRVTAVLRVLRRSWRFHRDPASRPEMPADFVEHLDRDYWDFIKYVWSYQSPVLGALRPDQQVVVVRTRREKQALVHRLQRD